MVGWRGTRGLFACLYTTASKKAPAFQRGATPSKPPQIWCSTPLFACHQLEVSCQLITLSIVVDFCQIPCLNGGRCIGRDECWCPANSTGKFCHLPVPQPDREPPGQGSRHSALLEGPLKQSTFTLPLSNQLGECQPGRCTR